MSITEKATSWEAVCEITGTDPVKSLPFQDAQTAEEKAINGFTKTIRTIAVLNEGWIPDWDDSSQRKYYAWFDMESDEDAGSASGFSFFALDVSTSGVGSRLVLKSEALVRHLVKYFLPELRAWMVIEK